MNILIIFCKDKVIFQDAFYMQNTWVWEPWDEKWNGSTSCHSRVIHLENFCFLSLQFLGSTDLELPLPNKVEISHVYLFKFKNVIKLKIKFFSCTSHISSAQQPHETVATIINSTNTIHFHYCRMFYWTALLYRT